MIVVCLMRTDQRSRDYIACRLAEGKTKREVMRCLKRYVAREIYHPGGTPAKRKTLARTTRTTSKTT